MLGKAIKITAIDFGDVKDKGGKPYILHCIHVMNKVRHLGSEVMQIGVMHDLVEDTDWTLEGLKDVGFSDRVVNGVAFMTHIKGVPYMDYIKIIASNPDARAVKMADLKHNSDLTRLKGHTQKDLDRLAKYAIAFQYLKEY